MKKTIILASLLGVFAFSNSGHAALIAGWNFNDPAPAEPATILPATVGTGTLNFAGWGGGVNNFTGTTVNALPAPDDAAGRDLALQGNPGGTGGAPFGGNGTFVDFAFSTLGLQDVVLTYAQQRSATGYTSNVWSFSTDGVSFEDVETFTFPGGSGTATTYAGNGVFTVDFSAFPAINDAASVIVRLTLDGVTAAAGNNRFDNVQFNATIIPEPASITLLLVSGVAFLGLRRRLTR